MYSSANRGDTIFHTKRLICVVSRQVETIAFFHFRDYGKRKYSRKFAILLQKHVVGWGSGLFRGNACQLFRTFYFTTIFCKL